MRIIISPAKKMNVDTDSLAPTGLPQFLPEAEQLLQRLQEMDDAQLKSLWRCNDSIAKLNVSRVREMRLSENLTPAILSYEGIQYQYMAPGVFETGQFSYINRHLRILSGFYGLLRPFDGVVPYRLEMQAKLCIGVHKNLYDFWGDKLATQLTQETDWILNLASKEYSKAVLSRLSPGTRCITCTFGELSGDKILEKGTLCKMARGEMVRWMAENHVTTPEGLLGFSHLQYCYSPQHSTPEQLVFIRNKDEQ